MPLRFNERQNKSSGNSCGLETTPPLKHQCKHSPRSLARGYTHLYLVAFVKKVVGLSQLSSDHVIKHSSEKETNKKCF